MFRRVLILIVSLTSFCVVAQVSEVDWKQAYEDVKQTSEKYKKRTETRLKKYRESEKVLIEENRVLKSKLRAAEKSFRRLSNLDLGAIMTTDQVEKYVENSPKSGPGTQIFQHKPLWLVTTYFEYNEKSSLIDTIGMDIEVAPSIFQEYFADVERGDIIIVPCSIMYEFIPPPKHAVETVRLTGTTGVGRYEFSVKYSAQEGEPILLKMEKK